MSDLGNMAEGLAAAVLLANPNDLGELAGLHDKLQAVMRTAQESGAGNELSTTASHAADLVERIILRDVTDANGAIEQLCRQVMQIQAIVTGVPAAPEAAPQQPDPAIRAEITTTPASEDKGVGAGEALPKEEDLPLVGDFMVEAREHLATAEADLLKLEEHPEDMDLLNSVFRGFHTIKGVAGFLNLRQIGTVAHAAETLLDAARKGQLALSGGTLDVVLDALDLTKGLLAALEKAMKEGTSLPPEPRIARVIERLVAAGQGKDIPAKQQESAAAAPVAPAAQRPVEAEEPRSAAGSAPEGTVKVTTTRLDALINMVGELVIAQAMVSQDFAKFTGADQRVVRNVSHLGKITRELQDLTMAMRMVPIQGVFQKMSRLVRDLGRKSGKQIELKVTGAETELDRNLVEAISDPLVHMVRNAADHGIEMPADRVGAGKSPEGHVELKAYHQAGSIVVEICDDGRGLNKARIRAKAEAAGLVKENQELTEQEIFRLIFAPGLSTAEKVTDVSGRGVGMDVVKRNVEALRGRIDISSAEGKGSTFAIRLPLTLAVIDGLVVKVGGQKYILPITSIEQSLRPKPEQLSTVQNRGEMCMIRGSLLPVVRLHGLFHVQPAHADPCEGLLVLVQDGTRRACLLVDELLGQQQVVIKSMGEATGAIAGVSGGAILGDGTISLILDVPGLIELATHSSD